MTSNCRMVALLVVTVAFGLHAGLRAEDKKAKEPAKKKTPAPDVVVNGELDKTDLKDKATQGPCKTFTFKMEKDKSYLVELTSTAYPAYVRLENSAGTQIDADASRFGVATAFHRSTKTEDYTIIATAQNANAVGKFTLTVKEVDAGDGKPVELKVENGNAAITSQLLRTDPGINGAGGKRHRLFLVNFEKGKTYQIDMTSKAFDSYLFLQSPGGQAITQNDDGGGYPSAKIVYKATESGKHRILSTYFGNGHGTFNLSIRQTD